MIWPITINQRSFKVKGHIVPLQGWTQKRVQKYKGISLKHGLGCIPYKLYVTGFAKTRNNPARTENPFYSLT